MFRLNGDLGRWLPIKQVGEMQIGAMWVVGSADLRTQKDALGVIMKNAESHGVTTMWGNANKVAKGLGGFTGKRGMINLDEYWLIPMEPKKWANIHCVVPRRIVKGICPFKDWQAVQFKTVATYCKHKSQHKGGHTERSKRRLVRRFRVW
jgi:hypothetical protein